MIYNGTLLLNLILADATILASVDTYGATKAIFHDNVVPSNFTGNKSINIYQTSPAQMVAGHDEFRYTASCRGRTFDESLSIARTLITQLNRYTKDNKGIKMLLLPGIPPRDDTDNFNTPVEIYFISKQ